MRIREETDMFGLEYFKDLKQGTAFQFLNSAVLFMKIDEMASIVLSTGEVVSMGTPDEFLRIRPRYNAVITFENYTDE